LVYALVLLGLVGAGIKVLRPALPADSARLLRVIDGDTLKVDYLGRSARLRLIGLDAPESADNPKARRDAYHSQQTLATVLYQGQAAKNFVLSAVKPGDVLKLEFDAQKQDHYGRWLAYVYLPDGRMLNDLIIRRGYAKTMAIPPNVKYQERFAESLRRAQAEHAGLWGNE
jgi:micrococcal nuclease